MNKPPNLSDQLKNLVTEQRNPATHTIDALSVNDILTLINHEDKKIALAVEKEIPYITKAVEIIYQCLHDGGRLLYVGAGTSGRLGVLDAVECPPTYGTEPELIQGIIAGGDKAMFRAQEGVEDREEFGRDAIADKNVGKDDVVCGITASLRTPFVVGAIKHARKLGAKTLYVTTNSRASFTDPVYTELAAVVDVAICPEVGPEVIMGSTRMKSGTAQKMILNMLTTAAMIRLGKVYENMMIDLQTTNDKLRERAKRVVMAITGVTYDEATAYLEKAGGHVKTALVMIKARVSLDEAKARLRRANGYVRKAIEGR